MLQGYRHDYVRIPNRRILSAGSCSGKQWAEGSASASVRHRGVGYRIYCPYDSGIHSDCIPHWQD